MDVCVKFGESTWNNGRIIQAVQFATDPERRRMHVITKGRMPFDVLPKKHMKTAIGENTFWKFVPWVWWLRWLSVFQGRWFVYVLRRLRIVSCGDAGCWSLCKSFAITLWQFLGFENCCSVNKITFQPNDGLSHQNQCTLILIFAAIIYHISIQLVCFDQFYKNL